MKKFTFSLVMLGTILTTNAQVGVNTTTPSATLDIVSKGNTATTKALEINDNTDKKLVHVYDNGYVGIGADTPADLNSGAIYPLRLDVGGIVRVGDATKSELRLDYGNTTIGRAYAIYNNDPADATNGLPAADNFTIYEANKLTGTEKLRFSITSDAVGTGYVYIPSRLGIALKATASPLGTTYVPFSTLEVNGSFATSIVLSASITPTSRANKPDERHSTVIANGTPITLPDPTTATGRIYTIYQGSATTKTITTSAGSISDYNGSTTSITIDNTIGNRGVVLQSDGTNWVVTGRLN